MEIKQRIEISGRNWGDIIKLPCFRELARYGEWSLLLAADRVDGREVPVEEKYYGAKATVGDTLVGYADGGWGVERKGKPVGGGAE